MVTFQIAAVAGAGEAWAVLEPGALRRVIRGRAAALASRQRVDLRIATRLAAGWVPVDGGPGAPRVPLPSDLVLQISSLLEALARARHALGAADPSGQLWAACHLFRQQAWRFGVGAPGRGSSARGGNDAWGSWWSRPAISRRRCSITARRWPRTRRPGRQWRPLPRRPPPDRPGEHVRQRIACVHAARTIDSTSAAT